MQCAQERGGVEGGDDSTNACAHICGFYRCAEVWAVPSALNRCLLTLSCDGSLRVRTAGAIGAYCFKNHQVSASRVSLSVGHTSPVALDVCRAAHPECCLGVRAVQIWG